MRVVERAYSRAEFLVFSSQARQGTENLACERMSRPDLERVRAAADRVVRVGAKFPGELLADRSHDGLKMVVDGRFPPDAGPERNQELRGREVRRAGRSRANDRSPGDETLERR